MAAPFAEMLEPLVRRLGRTPPAGPVLFSFNGGAGALRGRASTAYEALPAFRETVDRAAPIVEEMCGWDVVGAFTAHTAPSFKPHDIVASGLVQLGQLALWRERGMEPDVVLGLSGGEPAAVHAAGGLGFDDTVRVLCAIAEAARDGRAPHTLFTVDVAREQAAATCAAAPVPMAFVGTIDPDASVVISALPDTEAARAHLEARHRVRHSYTMSLAAHSRLAPTTRPAMERMLGAIEARPLDRPCVLASAGRDVHGDAVADHRYWSWMYDHRFLLREALDAAVGLDPSLVVEIGTRSFTRPHLVAAIARHGGSPVLVDSVRDDEPLLEAWRRASRTVRSPARSRRPPEPRVAPDVRDPAVARVRWEAVARLRASGPVHHLAEEGVWAVLEPDAVPDGLAPRARSAARRRDPRPHAEEILRAHAGEELDVVGGLARPVADAALADPDVATATARLVAWAVLALDRGAAEPPGSSALEPLLDEVLRLHPPVPFVERVATRDVRIGAATIPAGAPVVIGATAEPDRGVAAATLAALLAARPRLTVCQPACAVLVESAFSYGPAELVVA